MAMEKKLKKKKKQLWKCFINRLGFLKEHKVNIIGFLKDRKEKDYQDGKRE